MLILKVHAYNDPDTGMEVMMLSKQFSSDILLPIAAFTKEEAQEMTDYIMSGIWIGPNPYTDGNDPKLPHTHKCTLADKFEGTEHFQDVKRVGDFVSFARQTK